MQTILAASFSYSIRFMSQAFHRKREDFLAMICGTVFVAFGLVLFDEIGLLTGGTAGLALILTHLIDLTFGQIFFLLNLPFYWLAFTQMGKRFCLKTFVCVTAVSIIVDYSHWVVTFDRVVPLFAGVVGGLFIGMGVLILFRHQGSLGGIGILAFYLQSKNLVRAGKFQMAVDCSIVLASFFIVSVEIVFYSVLGAIATNLLIAANHKPGRYQVN